MVHFVTSLKTGNSAGRRFPGGRVGLRSHHWSTQLTWHLFLKLICLKADWPLCCSPRPSNNNWILLSAKSHFQIYLNHRKGNPFLLLNDQPLANSSSFFFSVSLVFINLLVYRFHIQGWLIYSICLPLTYSLANVAINSEITFMLWLDNIPLYICNIYIYVHIFYIYIYYIYVCVCIHLHITIPFCIHPSTGTSVFPYLSYCKQCCNKYGGTDTFLS